MRLTALVDGLAVQFAAHDGMMDRDQLIEHVQSLAAWEVGIDRAAFDEVAASEARTVRPAVAGHRRRAAPARRPLLRRVQPGRRGDVRRPPGPRTRCGASASSRSPGGRRSSPSGPSRMTKFAWAVQSAPQMVFEVDERARRRHRSGHGAGALQAPHRSGRRSARHLPRRVRAPRARLAVRRAPPRGPRVAADLQRSRPRWRPGAVEPCRSSCVDVTQPRVRGCEAERSRSARGRAAPARAHCARSGPRAMDEHASSAG